MDLKILEVTFEKVNYVIARCFAPVSEINDRTDLGQRQATRLGITNEPQAGDRVIVVLPISVLAPFRLRKEANVLVIADCLCRYCRFA